MSQKKSNDAMGGLSALHPQKPLRATLQTNTLSEAVQVVHALIRFERSLRRENMTKGVPQSGLVDRVGLCRRKLQVEASLVSDPKPRPAEYRVDKIFPDQSWLICTEPPFAKISWRVPLADLDWFRDQLFFPDWCDPKQFEKMRNKLKRFEA